MPTAKATPTPRNDKIQPELYLENQVESERSQTHTRLSLTGKQGMHTS